MIIIEIIYNISILVAITIISGFIKPPRSSSRYLLLQGFIFGTAAVMGMLHPLVFYPGVYFDGRSVMISLCAAFFGPVAAGVAGAMAMICRMLQGGVGVLTGVFVIMFAILLGLGFYYWRLRKSLKVTIFHLWVFGLWVHMAMIASLFTLPADIVWIILKIIAIPIILVYPLATAFIGGILLDFSERARIDDALAHAAASLRESGDRLRIAFDTVNNAMAIVREDNGIVVECNEKLFGYKRDEVVGRKSVDLGLWADVNERKKCFEILKEKGSVRNFETLFRKKDGGTFFGSISANKIILDEIGHVLFSIHDISERKQIELSLKKSQLLLVETESMGKVGGWEFDIDTGKQIWTAETYNIHEVPHDYQPTLESGIKFYPPASRSVIERAVRAAIDQGQSFDLELEFVTAKGNLRFVHVIGKADLEQRRVYGFFQDVTERRRAEESLRQTNELFALFMHHSPVYTFIKEVTPGCSRVLQASDNFKDMVGVPGQEMVGKTMADLFPPEFSAKITRDDWAVVCGGEVLRVDEDLNGRNYTTIKFPIVQRGKTLLAGYTIDITERKRAEDLVREGEEKYRSLFNNAEVGMFRSRLDGSELLDVNNKYLSILGWTRGEIIGKPSVIVWVDPNDREVMVKTLKAQGYVDELEFRLRNKMGEVRWCLTSVRLYPETGILEGSIIDITDRRQIEWALKKAKTDAEAASQAKSEFLNNIAHDFRTPMHAIMGFSGLLMSEPMSEKQHKFANIIHERSSSLLDLVEDLLSVSRLETGKLELRSIEFDLRRCVADAVEMARIELADKDVNISAVIEHGIPRLKGDEGRFNQILTNLVSNAVKYTDKGGIIVKLGVDQQACADDKCRIRLVVQDTGFGIEAEHQTRIFDAFTRFHEFEGGKERSGVGLGMYITKRLVDLMQGEIGVVSQVGVGSEFVVVLEFDKVNGPAV
ncbi:MAG: PAS domain S-box protein [Candidatus Omnitrophica bacterium]|nr:PAS domain S-box protein [Candidatus Omnitrophota bacterium]